MKRKPVKRITNPYAGDGEPLTTRLLAVEEGIRDIIADLNLNHGFRTWMSCEGGREHGSPGAWISMKNPGYDQEDFREMREVIKSHTDVPFKIIDQKEFVAIAFAGPIAEPYVSPESSGTSSSWDESNVKDTLWARGEREEPELSLGQGVY